MKEAALMSETPTVNPALSAGALLRLAREQQGMHIAMLAAQIKVPVKKVQALESDQLDEFVSPVFARSLAASICRVLKVDPAPVLALLPQAENLMLSKPSRIQEDPPVRFRPSSTGRSGPSRTTLWVAGGLALVTLLVAFVPDLSSRFSSAPEPSPAMSGVTTESVAPVANLANQVQVPEVPASGAAVVEAGAPPTLPSAPAPAPAPASVLASAPAPATAAVPAAPVASAPAPASAVLGLTARADSWIQVADAQGQLILSRVVNKGETVKLDGALPLKVVIGRADQTEVSVRGKPFSMTDIAQGNVARFEVK
jgi:cytoskeleton protein RodZ